MHIEELPINYLFIKYTRNINTTSCHITTQIDEEIIDKRTAFNQLGQVKKN